MAVERRARGAHRPRPRAAAISSAASRSPVARAWSAARPGPDTQVSMQPRRPHQHAGPGMLVGARPRAADCGPIRRRCRAGRRRRRAVEHEAAAAARAEDDAEHGRARRRRRRRSLPTAQSSWRRWRAAPAGRGAASRSRRERLAVEPGRVGVLHAARSPARASPACRCRRCRPSRRPPLSSARTIAAMARERRARSRRAAAGMRCSASAAPPAPSATPSILVPPRSMPRRSAGGRPACRSCAPSVPASSGDGAARCVSGAIAGFGGEHEQQRFVAEPDARARPAELAASPARARSSAGLDARQRQEAQPGAPRSSARKASALQRQWFRRPRRASRLPSVCAHGHQFA